MAKVSAYNQGLVSPTGFYKLDVQGGPTTALTYWWQASVVLLASPPCAHAARQFCGNMNFRTTLPAQRPVCGNNAFSMCPEACKEPNTKVCGNGCASLMAQQYSNSANAYCWSLGQWSNGADVSLALYNPSDPTAGIIYTLKRGDSQGCSGGARRSLSIAIQCPAAGALGQAEFPTTVTDLGNCAYAMVATHPSACPYVSRGSSGWSWGNSFLLLFFLAFGLYFVGGALFRYRQLDMRGAEVIPHAEFWREVPGLVVDGAGFAMAKGRELYEGLSGAEPGASRYVSHAAQGFQTIG